MVCPKCKSEIEEGIDACPECGEKLKSNPSEVRNDPCTVSKKMRELLSEKTGSAAYMILLVVTTVFALASLGNAIFGLISTFTFSSLDSLVFENISSVLGVAVEMLIELPLAICALLTAIALWRVYFAKSNVSSKAIKGIKHYNVAERLLTSCLVSIFSILSGILLIASVIAAIFIVPEDFSSVYDAIAAAGFAEIAGSIMYVISLGGYLISLTVGIACGVIIFILVLAKGMFAKLNEAIDKMCELIDGDRNATVRIPMIRVFIISLLMLYSAVSAFTAGDIFSGAIDTLTVVYLISFAIFFSKFSSATVSVLLNAASNSNSEKAEEEEISEPAEVIDADALFAADGEEPEGKSGDSESYNF